MGNAKNAKNARSANSAKNPVTAKSPGRFQPGTSGSSQSW